MNYNINVKINADNPNDLAFNEYAEIDVLSNKIENHIIIFQEDNIIALSSFQIEQLRKILDDLCG